MDVEAQMKMRGGFDDIRQFEVVDKISSEVVFSRNKTVQALVKLKENYLEMVDNYLAICGKLD